MSPDRGEQRPLDRGIQKWQRLCGHCHDQWRWSRAPPIQLDQSFVVAFHNDINPQWRIDHTKKGWAKEDRLLAYSRDRSKTPLHSRGDPKLIHWSISLGRRTFHLGAT